MKVRYKNKCKLIIAVLLTLSSSLSVQANQQQSYAEISRAVKEFVIGQQVHLNNLEITLTSLNKNMIMPQCDRKLDISMALGAKLLGNTTLAISCKTPQKWKRHVAAHIDGKISVLVARHPIPRGTLIQNDDVEFINRKYSQLNRGYYNSAKSLENMEAKRNIKLGQVITANLLKAQKLVLRGQHITIVAENAGLNLRVQGKALMDGEKGQTIKVTNLSSKKLIYARVVSAGIVKVNF